MNGNMAVQQHIPIPKGFEYVTGEKIDGFVIRNTDDGSDFTWVPVDILELNGTLDGEKFCEKFGRRNFHNERFSQDGYHESVNPELLASVEKYGGFYFPRYVASNGNRRWLFTRPVFRKNAEPWIYMNYYGARDHARAYARGRSDIGSCEVCGAAWDSIMQWLIQTTKITENYTLWKNEQEVNHIAGFAENVYEWTSEEYGIGTGESPVRRSGFFCKYNGNMRPAAREWKLEPGSGYLNTYFRLLLYVK